MPMPINRPSSTSSEQQQQQPTPIDPTGPQPAVISLPPSTHTTVPPPTATSTPPAAGSASTSSAPPTDPGNLPPAALDLAAKIFDLARNGDTITLSQYLSAGIPANLTNHAGDTLLMLSAYHGHLETTKLLIEHGGDINRVNGRGQSPLAGVVFKGFDEVAKLLFESGADVRAGQPSALDCAYMFHRREVLGIFGERIPDEEPAPSQREWA